MPLYRCPASDAIDLRKANEHSFWGNRESRNRVEPIATPHFDFDLRLEPGDRIFTAGSCFARNVEGRLAQAGFRVPMRELMESRSFTGVPANAVSNFSPPSLWNELSWAIGEGSFDPELGFAEYTPGKWIDLHVTGNVRPAARDTVLRRRKAIANAYRSFVDCRLTILTLGLVECWFDTLAGRYLNSVPPPPLVRRAPDRFELHVLDHAETLDYLQRAIAILRAYGRPDQVILLSVSPVALGVTHRPQDVMTANCYSKSVLRSAAEEIVARHDHVHYFPSYESVTLTDRRLAIANDFTHVTDTLIAYNVDRLVQRLAPSSREGFADARAEIEAGGAAAAYRHALEARKLPPPLAARFFSQFSEWDRSPSFATEHVEWLVDQRQAEKALQIADAVGTSTERIVIASARALLMLKRPREALARLYQPALQQSRSNRYWSIRVEAEGKAGALDALEESLGGWCRALPKKKAHAQTHVARALLAQSAPTRALELLELALVGQPDLALAHLLAAEAHVMRGDAAAACRSFECARPSTTSEERRYNKLKDVIGALAGA